MLFPIRSAPIHDFKESIQFFRVRLDVVVAGLDVLDYVCLGFDPARIRVLTHDLYALRASAWVTTCSVPSGCAIAHSLSPLLPRASFCPNRIMSPGVAMISTSPPPSSP